MNAQPVHMIETFLRDAHQSLLATRLRTRDMLEIAGQLDKAGYWAMEVMVGATLDSAMRYLGEDPWDRLRLIRQAMPATRLLMLIRGQSIHGHKLYPDDIVEHCIRLARRNGIDIFRIFDPLNDVRNLEFSMKIAKREGAHAQATLLYTVSPVHTLDYFVQLGRQMKTLGADSLCLKDLAGMLAPYMAYELVTTLKKECGLPVYIQTQYTSGMGTAALLKSVEAGADGIDTVFSSMSQSTTQPPTESLAAILRNTPRDPKLNLEILSSIAQQMGALQRRHHYFESGVSAVDMHVIHYQIPGQVVAHLAKQLNQQGAMRHFHEVMREIHEIRKDMGYPPMVVPLSQLIGTQAILNVTLKERYKIIPDEMRRWILGYYGRMPGEVNPNLLKIAAGDEKPFTGRPADLLSPGWESAKKDIGNLATSDEDILSYALFPQIAKPFLMRKAKGMLGKEEIVAAIAAKAFELHDFKSKQGKRPERSGPVVTPWKIAGRTHLARR